MINELNKMPKTDGTKKVLEQDLVKILPDGRHQVILRAGKVLSKNQFDYLVKTYGLTAENTLSIFEEKLDIPKENKAKTPKENKAKE